MPTVRYSVVKAKMPGQGTVFVVLRNTKQMAAYSARAAADGAVREFQNRDRNPKVRFSDRTGRWERKG